MEPTAEAFRLGHAAGADWETLTSSCLEQMGTLPADANLGFVYVTDLLEDDLSRIAERLRERTGVRHWTGTVGLGVMVGGREYFGEPAIVAMAGRLPDESFRILPGVDKPGDPLPAELAEWLATERAVFGIVHADPRNRHVADILNALADETDAFLVGGITAARERYGQIADRPTEGGVSGVLFSAAVPAACGLTQGCSPVGDVHEVSSAEDNCIAKLDGRPALDVFREDIGELLARSPEKVAGNVHAALPVAGDDSGDYLVRNIVGVDPRRKLVAIGDRVGHGDRVMFVRRDGDSAAQDLDDMLKRVAARAGRSPQAALYYSCVARGPHMFGKDSAEPRAVQAALGDHVPLVGFFANGEISRNRVYGYTGVLAVLG